MKTTLTAALALLATGAIASAAPTLNTPTFNKDVLPVLQANCQGCHRPGEVAPMSFMSYESTRPWAKAIKASVLAKKMPPWFADQRYGHWSNSPRISAGQIQMLAAWADGGAPEGNAKDRPAPVSFPEGWQIKPDAVVQMPEPFTIPATGVLELPSIIIPGFDKDTWVTSIEVRPSNPAVVHHLVMSLRPHNPKLAYGAQPVKPKERDAEGAAIQRVTREEDSKRVGDGSFTGLETVWVPGTPPLDFRPFQAAKLIPAGYDIVLGMHYTPNGKATTDQTRVGFTVASEPPTRRFVTESPTTPHDEDRFRIPANEANWETETSVVFNADTELVWFMPHMHLRGKDMIYTLTFPTGESQTVLAVPHYDFDWQYGYYAEKPINVPKGTRLTAVAHYDNSANNKFNPNPNRDVYWGDQTWEEMMVPWFGVIVPRDTDPKKIVTYVPGVR